MTLPPIAGPVLRSADLPHLAGSMPAAGKAALQFEAFVLQTFIEAMLPQEAESVFGSGISGKYWKSMLAEKLAMELAAGGRLGIADMLAADRSAGGKGSS